jgi:hypothetical protein
MSPKRNRIRGGESHSVVSILRRQNDCPSIGEFVKVCPHRDAALLARIRCRPRCGAMLGAVTVYRLTEPAAPP